MKLKKLILAGFKSFADRTEFEFDQGISCIVGPNGCGKSNIVDAVKWVLGEQSAKSLRGSEMADVIFNGSAMRRTAGAATVTLVFDNDDGLLQPGVGSDVSTNGTVSITRRLYRDGQSEYLINKTPCRLKDIREMFMDTGVGRDAYSLIEQGRIGLFLQASHEDRRAIFDEAAGISKYKARKREALRKLERVQQNLLRLGDILAEVEKRLRSIKYQAGKARSYQVHTERLKELRSLHFLAQYHELSAERSEIQGHLDAQTDSLAALAARIDQLQAAESAAEIETVDLERAASQLQGRLATISASITTHQQRAEMLTARAEELAERIVTGSGRCERLEAKIADCETQIAARREQLQQMETKAGDLADQHEAASAEHDSGELALTHLQDKLEDEKTGIIDLLRRTAQLHNDIRASAIRRENLTSRINRLTNRADEVTESLRALLGERAALQARLGEIDEVIRASQARLETLRQESRDTRQSQERLQDAVASARERRSALSSRIEILRQMQQKLEGVASGVRRVLEARRRGKLECIRGMLGEFIETDARHAAVAEAALAGADQQLIVERFEALQAAHDELAEVIGENGSAEVVCLDRVSRGDGNLDGDNDRICPQAIARVIDWVRFEPDLAPLVRRLLGRTFVVRSLADAAAAAKTSPHLRFVTLDGELLEPDGRVRFGPAGRASGVIARRSELAKLLDEQKELDKSIDELQRQCVSMRNESDHLEQLVGSLRTAVYEANTERVECTGRLNRTEEQIAELRSESPLLADELKNLEVETDSAARSERQAREKADAMEKRNAERQEEILRLEERIGAARQRQAELADRITAQKVALAEAEQKRFALSESLSALNVQREQMVQDLSGGRAELLENRRRRDDAASAIQAAQAEAQSLRQQHQALHNESEELQESRKGLAERLEEIRRHLGEHRKKQQQLTEQLNARRIELGEIDVRIENLISRASEEMGMDLLELHKTYQHDENRDWDAVAAEIQDLRSKIERLGNVNLDAISEQDELQQRREFLNRQLQDIKTSQNQLNDLIRRINRQSREMFLESFQAIRESFHELFRKLFGGGKADIFLLQPDDVLESGIEIVARPPGKELRSLSLLSGGEKTMTALALIFSIFKSRPSPFCLLDEVDAALDEANNERFNRLVGEFVPSSQFIIISHAKLTMSMANVLYGVTMQEPGVSKRISVRFEQAGSKLDRMLEPVSGSAR